MSEYQDRESRAAGPGGDNERRRLRSVGYPDPFLVTRLPLEGTVADGVIRLGEKALLGFVHRAFPDGTRVRVGYEEWLFAERLDEGEQVADPAGSEATNVGEPAGKGQEPDVSEFAVSEPAAEPSPTEAGPTTSDPGASDEDHQPEPRQPGARLMRERSGQAANGAGPEVAGGPGEEAEPRAVEQQPDLFPDDLRESDSPGANERREGKDDSWTDAFRPRPGQRGEPDE